MKMKKEIADKGHALYGVNTVLFYIRKKDGTVIDFKQIASDLFCTLDGMIIFSSDSLAEIL